MTALSLLAFGHIDFIVWEQEMLILEVWVSVLKTWGCDVAWQK
jgi:hypothetical protein